MTTRRRCLSLHRDVCASVIAVQRRLGTLAAESTESRDRIMSQANRHAPLEIRVWQLAGALHANIPRSVVRTPRVIEHRPNGAEAPIGHREFADLALNILNLLVPPQRQLGGDFEPVKCFRGHCSAFAARYHADFAEQFIKMLPAGAAAIRTADIVAWIEQRRRAQGAEESHAVALSA
jgi:hypothetical protein